MDQTSSGHSDRDAIETVESTQDPGTPAGRRPRFYQTLSAAQPEFIAALDNLGAVARRAGPLDERSLHLIQIGACAAMRTEGGLHSHVRRGLSAGLSADEIRHAIMSLVSTIGFPNVVAALTWAEDELEKAGR